MRTRQELKKRGKIAFKSNYGAAVLNGIILTIAAQGVSFGVSLSDNQLERLMESMSWTMVLQVLRAAVPGLIASLIISIFVLAPFEVGCRHFFIENGRKPVKLSECLYGFKNNYWNIVMTMFLKNLYQNLWALLFVIPGTIKGYSYRLVPYLLAENPELSPNEAIRLSRRLMNGNKWKSFVLDLSFLGWEAASLFTLNILHYLYVAPYNGATYAEFYEAVKQESGYGSGGSEGFGGSENFGSSDASFGGGRGGYDENGWYDEPDPHED